MAIILHDAKSNVLVCKFQSDDMQRQLEGVGGKVQQTRGIDWKDRKKEKASSFQ